MSIIKSASSVFIFKQISLLCVLLSSVLLARMLGPEGRGTLAALLVIPNLIAAMSECGMRQTAVHYIGKRKNVDSVISNLVLYLGALGIIGTICAISYFHFSLDKPINLITTSISFIVITSLFTNGMRGVFLGFGDIKTYNNYIVLQNLLIFILLFFCFLFDFNKLDYIALVYILSNIGTMLALFIQVMIKYGKDLSFSPSIALAREMFKKSIAYGAVFALIVANYKFDIVMLSNLSTEASLGYYTISTQIIELIWQIPGALVVVIFSASANRNTSIEDICRVSRTTISITILLSLCICIIGMPMITWFFGEKFSQSYWSLLLLLPGAIAMIPFKIIYAFLAGEGKPLSGLYVMLFAVIVNIIFNYVLIPNYNELGAAVSASMSYFVSGLAMAYFFSKQVGVPIRDILVIRKLDFIKVNRK